MVARQGSVRGGLCFILKSQFDRIDSSEGSAIFIFYILALWLETAYYAHFYGVLGAYCLQVMTSSIVRTQKNALLCAETRRLRDKA